MNDNSSFATAIERLKTEDGVSPVALAESIGIKYTRLISLKTGRQKLPEKIVLDVVEKYPIFETYMKEADAAKADVSPDEILQSIRALKDDLIAQLLQERKEKAEWIEKYVKLLEDKHKGL